MHDPVIDFYKLASIGNYEDFHLETLYETCAILEDQVFTIAKSLPSEQRMIIEEYINTRNDLDVGTLKAALRWGKKNYK